MKVNAVSGWKRIKLTPQSVPTLKQYEELFSGRNSRLSQYTGPETYRSLTPAKIRRAVIMRRQGESWAEIGRCLGHSGATLKSYIDFLPLEFSA